MKKVCIQGLGFVGAAMSIAASIATDENPATPGSPYRRCPDMNKTIELIDFESQVDLHDGIAKTYDWYREYIFEGKNISAL